MILVTTRSEMLNATADKDHILYIKLNRFKQDETRALIRNISAGEALSNEAATSVLNRAEGVPLYVEELTRAVLETGLPIDKRVRRDQSFGGDIPSSLQSSLLARLDRLGPAKEIAQVAAIIGREFDATLLDELCRLSESALEAALTSLIGSGLIAPQLGAAGTTYSFKHALLQEAAELYPKVGDGMG
jgi:predicted ATPase